MDISELYAVIEARTGVEAQAQLIGIDSRLVLTIGCAVDTTLITDTMLRDLQAFNDEANNTITFIDGRLVVTGADNALFMFTFTAEKCNGGI